MPINNNKDDKNYNEQVLRRVVNTRQPDGAIEEADAERKLKEAQTMMLQMQINPHFLGNTLNVINWMAIEMTMCENPVSSAIGKLAKLFKSYSDATDYMTDFQGEIEFTNHYADILKLRYPDTFSLEWDIDEKYLNARVPRILLQPIVENAIYHGIKPLDEKGSVKISSRMENNLLFITVEDSGKGMTDESIRKMNSDLLTDNVTYGGHVGLRNVNQRLKLIYGNDYGVQLKKSATGGLMVVIKMPYTYMTAELNYKAKKNLSENYTRETRETIELLLRRMMSQRKKAEVKYVPYTKPTGYNPSYPSFDFENLYPDWKEGDYAFVTANMLGSSDRDMVISITGENEIFFNGEIPECFESDRIGEAFKVHGIRSYRVKFREGDNFLIVKQRAESERFKFEIYIGDESGPIAWPTEYNYKVCPVIPFGSMKDIEGFAFSRLYKKDEILPDMSVDSIEWVGPEAPPDVKKVVFDFASMTDYNTACAVTYATGNVKINHTSPIYVYADGEFIYSDFSGCFEYYFPEEKLICVDTYKTDTGFGFSVENGFFRAPGYESARKDLSWIWLEGVRCAGKNIQLTTPYVCSDGEKTFFRYPRKDTYMRPYLNTCFYGQWFYAIALGHCALLEMAQKLDKKEYIDYFTDSINLICEYYDYVQYDKKKFGVPTMLYSSTKLSDIIAVGPVGMCVWEYIRLTNRDNGKKLLCVIENALSNLSRSMDGVLKRPSHYAIDDLYMTLPLFARLGGKYFDDAITQIKGLYKLLYIKEKKLFSHLCFSNTGKRNKVPWCRGNGWGMLAFSELLMNMPEDHSDREYVLGIYREFAEGILNHQGQKGMWHQILDEPESYEESSGTAMFIVSLARGVKRGWISRDIVPKLQKAWNRLSEICIDDDGNVLGICGGAGVYSEREYYRRMGACMNDDHGVGIILLAGTEMIDL